MRIIVEFPTLNGIMDEKGELTQNQDVLRQWLVGQFEEPRLGPLPRKHTLTQIKDEVTLGAVYEGRG